MFIHNILKLRIFFIFIIIFFISISNSKSVTKFILKNDSIIYGVKKFEYSDTLEIIDVNLKKRNVYYYDIDGTENVKFRFELVNGLKIYGSIIDIDLKDSIIYIDEYIYDSPFKTVTTDTLKSYKVKSNFIKSMEEYDAAYKQIGLGLNLGIRTYCNALLHIKPTKRIGIKLSGSVNQFILDKNSGYQFGAFYSIIRNEKGEMNFGLVKGETFDIATIGTIPNKYYAITFDLNIKLFYLNIGYQFQNSHTFKETDDQIFANLGVLYYF